MKQLSKILFSIHLKCASKNFSDAHSKKCSQKKKAYIKDNSIVVSGWLINKNFALKNKIDHVGLGFKLA